MYNPAPCQSKYYTTISDGYASTRMTALGVVTSGKSGNGWCLAFWFGFVQKRKGSGRDAVSKADVIYGSECMREIGDEKRGVGCKE